MTRTRIQRTSFVLILCGFALAIACSDNNEAGEGKVLTTVYGESFIEDGIPADEVGDGWAVTFDSFKVEVEAVTIAGVTVPATRTLEISEGTDGAGHEFGSATVPEGTHTGASYRITRVDVVGSAVKGGVTKNFDWTFDKPTTYSNCENSTVVADGGEATFQITVHADHLLYDSLVSEDPNVLFQALADADADMDGAITAEELAATDIGGYDAGSAGDIEDMWNFLEAQVTTLGHVDGEGHCDAKADD